MNTKSQIRARDIALHAIEGRISLLEAVRILTPILHANPQLVAKEDYNTIIGIDSETDDLPIGRVRSEWDAGALAKKDIEIAECEMRWRDQILSVCRRILDRTGGGVGPASE